jgi:hypothetical protein
MQGLMSELKCVRENSERVSSGPKGPQKMQDLMSELKCVRENGLVSGAEMRQKEACHDFDRITPSKRTYFRPA